MKGTERATYKRRYDAILARERRQARAVALTVFELEPISVWEVIILPLLVINHVRQKQIRDLFVDNFVFTKRLAAQGALDLMRGDRTPDEVDQKVEDETEALIRATPSHLYGHEIREAQIHEIEAVRAHDQRLLEVEGEDYEDLVRHAYRDRREYEAYLDELLAHERKVSDAAIRTLQATADPSLANRMHAACREIRQREAGRIYDA